MPIELQLTSSRDPGSLSAHLAPEHPQSQPSRATRASRPTRGPRSGSISARRIRAQRPSPHRRLARNCGHRRASLTDLDKTTCRTRLPDVAGVPRRDRDRCRGRFNGGAGTGFPAARAGSCADTRGGGALLSSPSFRRCANNILEMKPAGSLQAARGGQSLSRRVSIERERLTLAPANGRRPACRQA